MKRGQPPQTRLRANHHPFWLTTSDDVRSPQGTIRTPNEQPCRTSTRTAELAEVDTEPLLRASRAAMVHLLPVSRADTDSSHLVVDTERLLPVSRVDTAPHLLVSRVDMERLRRVNRADTVGLRSSLRTGRLRDRDTVDLRCSTRTRVHLRERIRSCGSGSLRWTATAAARSIRRS